MADSDNTYQRMMREYRGLIEQFTKFGIAALVLPIVILKDVILSGVNNAQMLE